MKPKKKPSKKITAAKLKEMVEMGRKIGRKADAQTEVICKSWKESEGEGVIEDLVSNDRALIKFQLQCLSMAKTSAHNGDPYGKRMAQMFVDVCRGSRQLITAIREAERLAGQN